jgi:phosphohistidine phosphatase
MGRHLQTARAAVEALAVLASNLAVAGRGSAIFLHLARPDLSPTEGCLAMAERDLRAVRLLSSPLRRARETAELALSAGLAPSLELAEALAPGGEALAALPAWLESLEAPAGASPRLLLVGHEPDLSNLAARLIGAPPGSLELRKAGLAVLRLPRSAAPGQATLRLLLSPRLLID